MNIAFITVGDTQRLTGGYLYHARLFVGLRVQGVLVHQIVPCGAGLHEQMAAAEQFGAAFDPQRYDVVVIDALARGVVAPYVQRWQALRPVVVLVHQLHSVAEAEPNQLHHERALEAPLLRADTLVAVSEHGRDLLIARGVPCDRVVVVAPGFDRLEKPSLPNLHPLPPTPHPLYALCVAQWIPRKGITTLIQAWTLGRWPYAVLELIGETDADPAYAAQVRRLMQDAPPNQIIVRGTVSDVELQAAYERANLFMLPSRFEGYGMVYAEALAHGLPVVATTIAPVQNIVGAEAGVFVPPDDPAALAAQIERLVTNRVLWRRLADGALRRAATLPRWDDTVHQFQQVLHAAYTRGR
jgi:glycosyltransferase involved in cell wall biosynthesis